MLKSMKLVGNIGVKISCIFSLHYNIGNSIFLTVEGVLILDEVKVSMRTECNVTLVLIL